MISVKYWRVIEDFARRKGEKAEAAQREKEYKLAKKLQEESNFAAQNAQAGHYSLEYHATPSLYDKFNGKY